jgi:hypothetical protein
MRKKIWYLNFCFIKIVSITIYYHHISSQRKIFNKKSTNQTLVTVNSDSHYNEALLQLQHNNDINKNYSKNTFIEPESLSIPEDGRINYSTNRAQVHHGSKRVVKMLGKTQIFLLWKLHKSHSVTVNKTKNVTREDKERGQNTLLTPFDIQTVQQFSYMHSDLLPRIQRSKKDHKKAPPLFSILILLQLSFYVT